MGELQADSAKVDRLFEQTMVSTLRGWLEYAEEKLRGKDVACIITPGNDDDPIIDQVLNENAFVVAAEGKVVRIDDRHEMLSVGWSNPTPWHTPRECDEATLKDKIDALVPEVHDLETAIFNLHAPPYGSGLDEAPELNERIEPKRGGTVMASTGSTAVRDAIRQYQPLMGLHGHIHEARGHQKIGRTLCINPGSTYGDGSLNGVLFELRKGKVRSHVLTMG
jgi:Icc-related predicted phosphoesterase